jgi:hypothetical protein
VVVSRAVTGRLALGHVAVGWIFVTTIAAGIARVLRRK